MLVLIVPSIPFLAFATVAALAFNLRGGYAWRRAVLLAVNLVFLASFSHQWVAFVPFAGFLGLGYVAQRVTRPSPLGASRGRLFVALLLVTLAAFFWLKRYSFIPAATFLPFPYVLVGLSYVFFRVLHLIIDSHQEAIAEPVGPVSYLNYTLNFTSLISGPIQRYEDYRRMEVSRLPLDLIVMGQALERIVLGYAKVAIVSMLLGLAQHAAIDALAASQPLAARVGYGAAVAAIYPVYLYFNFSGYVDVVIGVARFFGIVLPENFDHPFSSENFIAFWSRWHITLSNWLKTYVYNPLMLAGMARVTAQRWSPYLAVGAFFITFFLVGLWHGQTSEFLFFGFLQGGGVAANKLYQVVMSQRLGRAGYHALCANPVYVACMRGLTFTWFTFTLFWFWSSWHQIGGLAGAVGPAAMVLVWLAIFAGATVILAGLVWLREALMRTAPALGSRYVRTAWTTALAVTIAVLIVVLDSPAPDIVYKAF